MPEIRQLRERAETDRPYLLAVCGVIDEWSDAEEQYDHAIKSVEAAQRNWTNSAKTPTLTHSISPRRSSTFDCGRCGCRTRPQPCNITRRSPTPAQPASKAAGGADHIVSHADVDRLLLDLRCRDDTALRDARTERLRLQRDLDRAELAAAAAFAAADQRPVEHVLTQQAELDTELRILARRRAPQHATTTTHRSRSPRRLHPRSARQSRRTPLHHQRCGCPAQPRTHHCAPRHARGRRHRRPAHPLVRTYRR